LIFTRVAQSKYRIGLFGRDMAALVI